MSDVVSAPDSKSSRQAELEELRQKSLAQSNAQKLAEAGATAITLSDWQAQQKALKDQERMSKTETAQMLHNYRGDTDEISSKLSTLKQEDRRSKQEAARFLHSYRGAADMVATKSPKTLRKDGMMPAQQGNAMDQMHGEESVAALAAGFNQNGVHNTADSLQQKENATFSHESAVMVDAPSVEAPAAVFPQNDTQASMGMTPEIDIKPKNGDEDWVSVESSTVPSPEKIEDMLAEHKQGSFDSGEDTMSRAVTEVADNLDDDYDDDKTEPVLTEAQLHASVKGAGHVSLRLDVEFSFGLVTNDVTPNTDKYMKAVSHIARSFYAENRPAGTGGHAIYNPAFEPFVRLIAQDETTDIGQARKRHLVHSSLPMFIINWAEAASTREGVKDVLKAAVQDGSFLRLALNEC